MRIMLNRLAALALLAPLLASAQERPLTAADVSTGWVGKTAIGTAASGIAVEMRLQADGSATLVAGTTSDSGHWRLFDQGFCTTWKKVRAGQERCYTGTVEGTAVKVINPDGSVAGRYVEFR